MDEAFTRWYHWARVPVGTPYPEADRMVNEAIARLMCERDALKAALERIAAVASKTGEPVYSQTEMHQFARDALS